MLYPLPSRPLYHPWSPRALCLVPPLPRHLILLPRVARQPHSNHLTLSPSPPTCLAIVRNPHTGCHGCILHCSIIVLLHGASKFAYNPSYLLANEDRCHSSSSPCLQLRAPPSTLPCPGPLHCMHSPAVTSPHPNSVNLSLLLSTTSAASTSTIPTSSHPYSRPTLHAEAPSSSINNQDDHHLLSLAVNHLPPPSSPSQPPPHPPFSPLTVVVSPSHPTHSPTTTVSEPCHRPQIPTSSL